MHYSRIAGEILMIKNLILSISITLIVTLSTGVNASSEPSDTSQFDISQYRGKVVYLDFWASWCVPCRKSFPWLNQQQQKYSAEDFVIIAVNLDKKRSLAEVFMEENPASFKIIYDPKGKLAKKYQIKGMPSSVIFDRNGKAAFAHTGFFVKKKNEYEQEIQNLIDSSKK